MTLYNFVAKYLGQFMQAPGGIGGQCVDLANLYLIECRSQAAVRQNAIDWHNVTVPGMTWQPNGPVNSPPSGSLVVWGASAEVGTGQYGHIALALAGDPSHFVSFDQDWPLNSPAALTLHSYIGVLGWLRPG
jgi:hypothetical protein